MSGLHERGNKNCPACCCGIASCVCGGLIHMSVYDEVNNGTDEDSEWDWVHSFRCDKCSDEDLMLDECAIEFTNSPPTKEAIK